MTSTYTPSREVSVALVAALRGDVGLHGLLFPSWSPSAGFDDERVYSNHVELPESPAVREALPRILLDVIWRPHDYEQEQVGTLHGSVGVYLHVITPKEQEEYGELLVASAMKLILSTRLSGARIIAAELVPTTDVLKQRIEAFNGAWEWVAPFRSTNVGVLV